METKYIEGSDRRDKRRKERENEPRIRGSTHTAVAVPKAYRHTKQSHLEMTEDGVFGHSSFLSVYANSTVLLGFPSLVGFALAGKLRFCPLQKCSMRIRPIFRFT